MQQNQPTWKNKIEKMKNKTSAIEPCAFTTEKSKVQHLDTDIARSVFNNNYSSFNFVQK